MRMSLVSAKTPFMGLFSRIMLLGAIIVSFLLPPAFATSDSDPDFDPEDIWEQIQVQLLRYALDKTNGSFQVAFSFPTQNSELQSHAINVFGDLRNRTFDLKQLIGSEYFWDQLLTDGSYAIAEPIAYRRRDGLHASKASEEFAEEKSVISTKGIFEIFYEWQMDLKTGMATPDDVVDINGNPIARKAPITIVYLGSVDLLFDDILRMYHEELQHHLDRLSPRDQTELLVHLTGTELNQRSGVSLNPKMSRFLALFHMEAEFGEKIEIGHIERLAEVDTAEGWQKIFMSGFDDERFWKKGETTIVIELAEKLLSDFSVGTIDNKLEALIEVARYSQRSFRKQDDRMRARSLGKAANALMEKLLPSELDEGVTREELEALNMRSVDELLPARSRKRGAAGSRCAFFF